MVYSFGLVSVSAETHQVALSRPLLSYGEMIAKIGPVHPTQFPSIRMFSVETTRPIFTKILHYIVALAVLLSHV